MKAKQRKRYRFAALLMAGLLALLCAGCGSGGNQIAQEDPSKVPEEPYEINWYMYGTTLKDVASVENEINAYLKDKINATVKINRMEASQYKDKMSNMIQAGEYFDMCYVANWMVDYVVNAENGAFVALDGLFDKYLPETYQLSDPVALECVRVDGKVYALPVIKENALAYGWVYRKDLADKYNIDMSQVKSFEDLEAAAKIIKENEPDIKFPVDWDAAGAPSGGLSAVNVLQGYNIGYKKGDETYTLINRLEQPEIMEEFKLARRFYEEGLVKEDILTNNTDTTQRLKNGQTFCALVSLKPGKAQELFKNTNYEFEQQYLESPRKPINSGISSMTAISATSKNPARVARFMELLNTDEYLNNLVVYGIEGKHYEKVSDKVVRVLPNSGYTLSGSQWTVANIYLTYCTEGEDPDKNRKLKEFDDSASPHPLSGFRFVTESVQAELAACQAVEKQYNNQVVLGAMDPEPIVPEYIAALKSAGIDTVIAEMQKQLNAFLENKKS